MDNASFPRAAVGAVVVRNGTVLLVKRANMPGEGLWAIPGGRINPGETLHDAARRELLEETGVVIIPGEVVHVFDYIERNKDGSLRFHYVIVDLMGEYVSGEPDARDDAMDARFMSPGEVVLEKVSSSTLELLKKLGFIT